MSRPEEPIHTTGKVTEVLSEHVCLLELPNGKVTCGHLSKQLRESGFPLVIEDRLHLEMTPFDFSKARITGAAKPIL